MCEEVFATLVGGDKAETLGIIKPFDDAISHVLKLRKYVTGLSPGKGANQDGEVRMRGMTP